MTPCNKVVFVILPLLYIICDATIILFNKNRPSFIKSTRRIAVPRRSIAPVDGETKSSRWENISSLAEHKPQFTQVLTNLHNLFYVGTIHIGIPPRPFQMMFDTGSTLTWVRSKNSSHSAQVGRVYYHELLSRTSTKTRRKFRIGYDDGVVTSGTLFTDFLSFGDYYNPKFRDYVNFGVADIIDEQADNRPYDGIFGLGFGESHGLITLMERNQITSKFDPSIFSVYMSPLPSKPTDSTWGGEIVFGSLNSRWCQLEAIFTQVIHTGDWRFHANQVHFNGIFLEFESEISSDTGTSAILVPKIIYNKIMKSLGLRKDGPVPAIRCNEKVSMTFKVNGVHLSLTEKHLITGYNGKCNLQMAPVSGNLWVFGTPMIRKYCHIYDMKSNRIGFANTVY